MNFTFYKYQGTGNDFVLIDDRDKSFPADRNDIIAQLCDRKFGIGADGLMLLQKENGFDFRMVYFNADGNESSMCGNGGRCIASFAKKMGVISDKAKFIAIDGPHLAKVTDESVSLQMIDVDRIEINSDHFFLDTGSPHYVEFIENVNDINIVEKAHKIRYNNRFKAEGTNVNFVEIQKDRLKVRTYERGVEDETLSCGTGVTAVAISAHEKGIQFDNNTTVLEVEGGLLEVGFEKVEGHYKDIWLTGPATFVFKGQIEV